MFTVAIFKCIGLFIQLNYIIYRFTSDNAPTVQYLNETEKSATWGRLIYTCMLPIPTLICMWVAIFQKKSLCARFVVMLLYMLESLVVIITPILFVRSVLVARQWLLLIVGLVYIMVLVPIRLLCVYTVRGYYLELRTILHKKSELNSQGDIESQRS